MPPLPTVRFAEARFVLWGWADPVTYERGCAFLYDSRGPISGMETTRAYESTRGKWERLRRERGLIPTTAQVSK